MADNSKKQLTVGRALLPLIIIPIMALADIGLVALGYAMDSAAYSPPADTPSFMFPAFTLLFMIIAAALSLIALIVMIILIAVRLSKARRKQEG
ncbi:MAG: hypothetical protein K6G58_11295 [Lachnospiraceae bacterium]|nr:hypothetical protein [Lachnospiraceae bacterium]